MSTDAKGLLREAEISAERSISYVRCATAVAVFVFFFIVVSPTLARENPALNLVPFFAAFTGAYFILGVCTNFLTRRDRFRGWMTWLFTTLDIGFWSGLLVAAVLIVEVPGNQIIALPPALIVFIILALVALRNSPWLQAYTVVFVVLVFIALYVFSPASVQVAGTERNLEFFELPTNIVRLSMVALAGLILIYLAARTRQLLRRAVLETVRRTNLSRYLPSQVASRLAQVDEDRLMSGTSQDAAVLFVDVRGFTSMAENMEPSALGRFLTRYRQIVSEQVHAKNGIVDKFVGDSVMAVFGAPDASGNDAANALDCASGIVQAIDAWNREPDDSNHGNVAVGVGVHWGRVYCGAIGDSARLEFTVLGDTVNVAARLEQLTKELDHPIVASQAILTAAGEPIAPESGWITIRNSQIRGRAGQVPIFARS